MKKNSVVLVLVLLVWCALSSILANAQTWIPLQPTGSSPPTGHSIVANYNSATNRLIVYFANNATPPPPPTPPTPPNTEVWVLTNANGLGSNGLPATPVWMKLTPTGTPPSATMFVTAVYDTSTNQLFVYGGCKDSTCATPLSDVFMLSNANGCQTSTPPCVTGKPAWSKVITDPEPAQTRKGHSAVYDSNNKVMIVFGGFSSAPPPGDRNDTMVLFNKISPPIWNTVHALDGPPSAREGHTAIYDEKNNIMTIFGGRDIVDKDDLWTLSNANLLGPRPVWSQLKASFSCPPERKNCLARSFHSAVYDPANNRMLVFGGAQDNTLLGDLWQLSNANGLRKPSTWKELCQLGTPPGMKSTHSAVFDSSNQRIILVGGNDGDTESQVLVFVLDLKQKCTIGNLP